MSVSNIEMLPFVLLHINEHKPLIQTTFCFLYLDVFPVSQTPPFNTLHSLCLQHMCMTIGINTSFYVSVNIFFWNSYGSGNLGWSFNVVLEFWNLLFVSNPQC